MRKGKSVFPDNGILQRLTLFFDRILRYCGPPKKPFTRALQPPSSLRDLTLARCLTRLQSCTSTGTKEWLSTSASSQLCPLFQGVVKGTCLPQSTRLDHTGRSRRTPSWELGAVAKLITQRTLASLAPVGYISSVTATVTFGNQDKEFEATSKSLASRSNFEKVGWPICYKDGVKLQQDAIDLNWVANFVAERPRFKMVDGQEPTLITVSKFLKSTNAVYFHWLGTPLLTRIAKNLIDWT